MSEKNPLPGDPHIDISHLFPPPPGAATPSGEQISAEQPNALFHKNKTEYFSGIHLSGAEWANIIFAVVTVLGGLFFTFNFFNGSEHFRRATHSGREFLYPRPESAAQQAMIATFRGADNARPFANAPWTPSDLGRNLFGPTNGPPNPPSSLPALNQNRPNLLRPLSDANPGVLRNGINRLASSGAGGPQSDSQAAKNAMRAKNLDAKRTVRVITTAVKGSRHGDSVRAKDIVEQAGKTLTKSTSHQTAKNSRQSTHVTGAAQNHAASAVRSANNSGRHTMGAGRSMMTSRTSGLGAARGQGKLGGGRRR